jgi:hypothetical protein
MVNKSINVLLLMVLILAFGMNSWAHKRHEGFELEKKQIVQTYYKAMAEGNADVVRNLFAPNVLLYENNRQVEVVPEDISLIATQIGMLFKDFHIEVHTMSVTDDGTVCVHVTHSGTLIDSTAPDSPDGPMYYQSPVGPFLVQGQTLNWQTMMRFKFNDQLQITEEWVVNDDLSKFMGGAILTLENW